MHTLPNLELSYIDVDLLKLHPSNARTHSKHQIRKIADSYDEFGITNPLLIDSRNTVIAGHGRLEAAKLRGISRVPIIRLEHLTPDQIRAYILADNKIATLAGWDPEILAIEL